MPPQIKPYNLVKLCLKTKSIVETHTLRISSCVLFRLFRQHSFVIIIIIVNGGLIVCVRVRRRTRHQLQTIDGRTAAYYGIFWSLCLQRKVHTDFGRISDRHKLWKYIFSVSFSGDCVTVKVANLLWWNDERITSRPEQIFARDSGIDERNQFTESKSRKWLEIVSDNLQNHLYRRRHRAIVIVVIWPKPMENCAN